MVFFSFHLSKDVIRFTVLSTPANPRLPQISFEAFEKTKIMKILCILYDDPKGGMPERYALDSLPMLKQYPDGMALPSPKAIDFKPGELLGCVSGELGLRKFLEENGHTLVVTSDKDGTGCQAEKELVDADIVISTFLSLLSDP